MKLAWLRWWAGGGEKGHDSDQDKACDKVLRQAGVVRELKEGQNRAWWV